MTKSYCFWLSGGFCRNISTSKVQIHLNQPPPAAFSEQSDLIKKLHLISRKFCTKEGGAHGPDHTERVFQSALLIGKSMNARLDILAPAALLHDIGRKQEREDQGKTCHAQRGAELAKPILARLGYCPQDTEAICHCIHAHRFRSTVKPQSLEAQILFDADKLDSIGAIGIGRAFLFAGQIGARLHNPETDHNKTHSYSTEDTAYREFQIKMSKVSKQMLTPKGKQLARERHAFMVIYFEQLNREIYGQRL